MPAPIVEAFRTVYRENDGSQPHKPVLAEIRSIGPTIQNTIDLIAMAVATGEAKLYQTKTAATDDLPNRPAGGMLIVYADGDDNGIYVKQSGNLVATNLTLAGEVVEQIGDLDARVDAKASAAAVEAIDARVSNQKDRLDAAADDIDALDELIDVQADRLNGLDASVSANSLDLYSLATTTTTLRPANATLVAGPAIGSRLYVVAGPAGGGRQPKVIRSRGETAGTFFFRRINKTASRFTKPGPADMQVTFALGDNILRAGIDFTPITWEPGEWLGLYNGTGKLVRIVVPAGTGHPYYDSGEGPIPDTFDSVDLKTDVEFQLSIEWSPVYAPAPVATDLTASVASLRARAAAIEGALAQPRYVIGRPFAGLAPGTAATGRTFTFAGTVQQDGVWDQVWFQAFGPGEARFKLGTQVGDVSTQSGDDFVVQAPAAGPWLFTLPTPRAVVVGQVFSFYAPGVIAVNASTPGDSGGYRASAIGNFYRFEQSVVTTNTRLQVGFGIRAGKDRITKLSEDLAALSATASGASVSVPFGRRALAPAKRITRAPNTLTHVSGNGQSNMFGRVSPTP